MRYTRAMRTLTSIALALALAACGTARPTSVSSDSTLDSTADAGEDAVLADAAGTDATAVADSTLAPDTFTDSSVAANDVADAPPPGADAAADAGADVASQQPLPADLHGVPPDVTKPLAAFAQVVDSAGAQVTADALQGHWTVLWFYPAAQTSG